MRDDVTDEADITHSVEVETPVPVDASLPEVGRLVVFLGAQRGVLQILLKVCGLF